jgi:protein SCO1/2
MEQKSILPALYECGAAMLLTEEVFAAQVTTLQADVLLELLYEDHPVYAQRGTATTARMRGWVLLALASSGLPEEALLFVLEELETGNEPYLVAAAARALRNYPRPHAEIAPFLLRAFNNIRYHDDLVCMSQYGGFVTQPHNGTTAVHELLGTLRWLGPLAQAVRPALEGMLSEPGVVLSVAAVAEVRQTIAAITPADTSLVETTCCEAAGGELVWRGWRHWLPGASQKPTMLDAVQFEDQHGQLLSFIDCFHGKPSIVVFFYTRCMNPQKCSLTVAKLVRVQERLRELGLAGRIRTAAITYDPAFDRPERLHGYSQNRGMQFDADHRALRAVVGAEQVKAYFQLGVNFISSLVNRHRIEAYVLDAQGRITMSFERLHWDEEQLLEQARSLLTVSVEPVSARTPSHVAITALLSFATAFFPKCAACWAMYLSIFGIASLERIPFTPLLLPVLAGLLLVNLGSLWRQGRSQRRYSGFYVAAAGMVTILVPGLWLEWSNAAALGVLLMVMGSLLSILRSP